MTSVKLNSIYYSTIQIHIQVVTLNLILHNRSETMHSSYFSNAIMYPEFAIEFECEVCYSV